MEEYEEDGAEKVAHFEEMLRQGQAFFPDADDYDLVIHEYLRRKAFENALQAARLAAEQYPYTLRFLLEQAKIHTVLGNTGMAMVMVDRALSMNPDDPDSLMCKASVLHREGKLEKAVICYEKALPGSSEPDRLHCLAALARRQMNRPDLAVGHYIQALDYDPFNESALEALLDCASETGRLKRVADVLSEKAEDSADSAGAWYVCGRLYETAGEITRALRAYEYAALFQENNMLILGALGRVYLKADRAEKAQKVFEEALRTEQTAELLCGYGDFLLFSGRPEDALKCFRKATKINENYSPAWFGCGKSLFRAEKWFEAVHFFSKAVKLDEYSAEYWLALAEAEQKTGNENSAESAYEKSAGIDGRFPAVWVGWSLVLSERADFEGAVSVLSEGLAELPDCAELMYRLCVALIYSGRYKEAINSLETALILDYDMHKILFELLPDDAVRRTLSAIIDRFR